MVGQRTISIVYEHKGKSGFRLRRAIKAQLTKDQCVRVFKSFTCTDYIEFCGPDGAKRAIKYVEMTCLPPKIVVLSRRIEKGWNP